jgi:hypothetical protein
MLMAGGAWVAGILFRLAANAELGWFDRAPAAPAGASGVLDLVIAYAAVRARRAVLRHSRPSLADGPRALRSEVCATRFPQRSIGTASTCDAGDRRCDGCGALRLPEGASCACVGDVRPAL